MYGSDVATGLLTMSRLRRPSGARRVHRPGWTFCLYREICMYCRSGSTHLGVRLTDVNDCFELRILRGVHRSMVLLSRGATTAIVGSQPNSECLVCRYLPSVSISASSGADLL